MRQRMRPEMRQWPGPWIKQNQAGLALLILAFLFIGFGAYRNEIHTVFQKAAAICLECIGIG